MASAVHAAADTASEVPPLFLRKTRAPMQAPQGASITRQRCPMCHPNPRPAHKLTSCSAVGRHLLRLQALHDLGSEASSAACTQAPNTWQASGLTGVWTYNSSCPAPNAGRLGGNPGSCWHAGCGWYGYGRAALCCPTPDGKIRAPRQAQQRASTTGSAAHGVNLTHAPRTSSPPAARSAAIFLGSWCCTTWEARPPARPPARPAHKHRTHGKRQA